MVVVDAPLPPPLGSPGADAGRGRIVDEEIDASAESDASMVDAFDSDAGYVNPGCMLAGDASFECPTNRATRYSCAREAQTSCVDGGSSGGRYYYCC